MQTLLSDLISKISEDNKKAGYEPLSRFTDAHKRLIANYIKVSSITTQSVARALNVPIFTVTRWLMDVEQKSGVEETVSITRKDLSDILHQAFSITGKHVYEIENILAQELGFNSTEMK